MNKSPLKKIITPNSFSVLNAFVLSLLIFVSYFSERIEILPNRTSDMFFFNLFSTLLRDFPFLSFLLGFILVILIAFLLFEFNEKFSLIRVRTIIPSLIFLFLILMSKFSLVSNSGLLAALFLMISLWSFLSTYQEKEPVKKIFNSFFFLSVGSFFFFDLLFFIPVFWISFSFLRIGSLRTYLASIIAVITPYLICLPILLVQGSFFEFIGDVQKQMIFSFPSSGFETYQIYYGMFLLFVYFLSFFYFLIQINQDRIKTRQLMYFIYILTFFVFVLCLFKGHFFPNFFPLLAMVFSFSFGHYLSLKNSRFVVFCFFCFITVHVLFFFLS